MICPVSAVVSGVKEVERVNVDGNPAYAIVKRICMEENDAYAVPCAMTSTLETPVYEYESTFFMNQ